MAKARKRKLWESKSLTRVEEMKGWGREEGTAKIEELAYQGVLESVERLITRSE